MSFEDYNSRRVANEKFNILNRWIKRGIGICPMEYPFGLFYTRMAQVNIYHNDGSVIVIHGAVEMGQGVNTKVAQVAARTLGVPLDTVQVKHINTVNMPNCYVTGGSFGTDMATYVRMNKIKYMNSMYFKYKLF